MKSIYIGNLSYKATYKQIFNLLAQFGEVNSLTMVSDRHTKRFKGYAFAKMEDENADTAISMLNGDKFMGRVINVKNSEQNYISKNYDN